jgi:hypothetical protein
MDLDIIIDIVGNTDNARMNDASVRVPIEIASF